jgi:hypothetical protein
MAQTPSEPTPPARPHRANHRTVPARDIRRMALHPASGAVAPNVAVPVLGNVVTTWADIGPNGSNNFELTVTITGLDLTTDVPSTVLLQPRQNANQDFGFPDLFSVMLITTARDHLVVRIARQDQGGGWGQDLRLDILIVDSVNNP